MKKQTTDIIKRELAPIVEQALDLNIKTPEEMVKGVEILSKLNQFNDRVVAERERITKPLQEALKVERSRWKPLVDSYENAIAYIRYEMEQYQTKLVLKQKEDEAKIAQKLTDGKITLDKAIAQIEKIKIPEKEIATTAGLVQFRETQILEITDDMLIPREYLMVDEKKLLTDLKGGKVVEGAKLTTILTPVNFR